MDIEQMFNQFLSGVDVKNTVIGGSLKPPVIVTDKYITENYPSNQILDVSHPVSCDITPDDNIKIIMLRKCNLRDIPAWVFQVHNLEGLLLDENPNLSNLPEDIKQLKRLKVLGLMRTNITNFSFLRDLNSIKSLDVSGNNLDVFPKEICTLHNLIYLDVSTYNTFTSIPKCIKNNSKLQILRAHYNNIRSLPESLGELTNLEYLILGKNDLSDLPSSLYKLKNLKELDLFGNNIHSINLKSLSELKELNEIYLSQNPIKKFPQELLNQKKGILSSLSLRRYFQTGVYYEISSNRTNDQLQEGRLLRSARALIIRGLFYGLQQDWHRFYKLVYSGYKLARELKNNKLSILSASFLEYLKVIKDSRDILKPDTYLIGIEYPSEIDHFSSRYDDTDYRESCHSCVVRYTFFSQSDIVSKYSEEQDFNLLLQTVFDDDFEMLKISDEDEMSHLMVSTIPERNPSFHSKKFTARNEINNRDLLRGYLETDLFKEAWEEVARQHCTNSTPCSIGYHRPVNEYEIYMYIFQLTNRDKIRVLTVEASGRSVLLELNSTSISLNAIITKLLSSDVTGLDSVLDKLISEGKSVEQFIWDTIFGAYIIKKTEDKKCCDLTRMPVTLHEYCQQIKISKVNLFPFGSLLGIPLYTGLNTKASKYVIDYYEIVNRPPFVTNLISSTSRDSIVIATHNDLPFSKSEAEIVKNFYNKGEIINTTDKDAILQAIQNYSIIHIACHAEDGHIKLKTSSCEIHITADDVKELDLSKCALVFFNACRTSEDPCVSLISDSSLPLSFLEAGAGFVLSTTKKINDDDAFRFAVKFHELYSSSKEDPSAIFRSLIQSCMNGKLPYFEDLIYKYKQKALSSHMKYLKKYNPVKEDGSWKYYSIWENNHE